MRTDMDPGVLRVYEAAFREAHSGPARFGLSIEVGTRRGGSALRFLELLNELYAGFVPPLLVTVDPYGYKPYDSGIPGREKMPIYGDPDYLAMKALLAKYPNHSHFKLTSLDFFDRLYGASFWFPGAEAFTSKDQPGEFALGQEKHLGNVAFCLLEGEHSSEAIREELFCLWEPNDDPELAPWMHPAGIVCIDNTDCDPETVPFLREHYRADIGPTWAIVRGLK